MSMINEAFLLNFYIKKHVVRNCPYGKEVLGDHFYGIWQTFLGSKFWTFSRFFTTIPCVFLEDLVFQSLGAINRWFSLCTPMVTAHNLFTTSRTAKRYRHQSRHIKVFSINKNCILDCATSQLEPLIDNWH